MSIGGDNGDDNIERRLENIQAILEIIADALTGQVGREPQPSKAEDWVQGKLSKSVDNLDEYAEIKRKSLTAEGLGTPYYNGEGELTTPRFYAMTLVLGLESYDMLALTLSNDMFDKVVSEIAILEGMNRKIFELFKNPISSTTYGFIKTEDGVEFLEEDTHLSSFKLLDQWWFSPTLGLRQAQLGEFDIEITSPDIESVLGITESDISTEPPEFAEGTADPLQMNERLLERARKSGKQIPAGITVTPRYGWDDVEEE